MAGKMDRAEGAVSGGHGIPTEIEGVQVEISGMHEEEDFVKDMVRKEVVNAVGRISKIVELSDFTVHLKKDSRDGKKPRYTIQAKAFAGEMEFFADEDGWDLPKALRGAVDKIENEARKKEDRSKKF